MASLSGQQIKDTYQGILKTSDSAAVGGTTKTITDGAGNSTPIRITNTTLDVTGSMSLTGSMTITQTLTVSGSTVSVLPGVKGTRATGYNFDTTSTVMSYGINYITGSLGTLDISKTATTSQSYADYNFFSGSQVPNFTGSNSVTTMSIKLPAPVKSKTVSVINKSDTTFRVFPYAENSDINGVAFSKENYGYFPGYGSVDIQPDGITYNFNCYDVVDTVGSWSTDRPTAPVTTLRYDTMFISHSQGARNFSAGVGTAYNAPYGYGAGIASNGSLTLLPTASAWGSEPFRAKATRMRVYTNIILSDFGGSYTYRDADIYCFFGQTYFFQNNGVTMGQRNCLTFNNYGVNATYPNNATYQVPGTVGDTIGIGDPGSLWGDSIVIPNNGIGLGDGLTYGRTPYHYTFLMEIGKELATKVYKFRFEIDYTRI
jgi:hypothetical protein